MMDLKYLKFIRESEHNAICWDLLNTDISCAEISFGTELSLFTIFNVKCKKYNIRISISEQSILVVFFNYKKKKESIRYHCEWYGQSINFNLRNDTNNDPIKPLTKINDQFNTIADLLEKNSK